MIQERTEHLHGIHRDKDTCSIDEALVYRSTQCALAWSAISRSQNYPYYREELELIYQLDLRTAGNVLVPSHRMIAIGPADSAKELALLRKVQLPLSTQIYVIDNSPHLLKVATHSFTSAGYGSVTSVWNDIAQYSDSDLYRQGLDNDYSHLVTCFGNTVGNYNGLDFIDLMPFSKSQNTLLILGLHLRELPNVNRYSAYYSKEYINHMRLIVAATGLDPDDGSIEVRVRQNLKNTADIVEHFYIPSAAQAADISKYIDFQDWGGTVLIDQSAKLDADYVRSFFRQNDYSIAAEMTHSSGRVCLLACHGRSA